MVIITPATPLEFLSLRRGLDSTVFQKRIQAKFPTFIFLPFPDAGWEFETMVQEDCTRSQHSLRQRQEHRGIHLSLWATRACCTSLTVRTGRRSQLCLEKETRSKGLLVIEERSALTGGLLRCSLARAREPLREQEFFAAKFQDSISRAGETTRPIW